MANTVKAFAEFVTHEDIAGLSYPMLYNYYQMFCDWKDFPEDSIEGYKNFGSKLRAVLPGFSLRPARDSSGVSKRVSFEGDYAVYTVGLTPGYMRMEKEVREKHEKHHEKSVKS